MEKIRTAIMRFKTEHPEAYNIITRALWTFAEVFVSVLTEALVTNGEAETSFRVTFIVAMSAGLSAVKTVILEAIKKKQIEKDEGDA